VSIVAKFGGSSVRDVKAIKRCCEIIKLNQEISIVVISAIYNSTNELEVISGLAAKNIEKANEALKSMFERHSQIAKDLSCYQIVQDLITQLINEAYLTIIKVNDSKKIEPYLMDEMYSYGERLSTLIISHYLKLFIPERNPQYFDVRKVLITDDQFGMAIPQIDQIKESYIRNKSEFKNTLIITQGFIGCTPKGETTTLGREGSDYSGTLLAEMINAKEVQIWTDVPGVATIDPNELDSAIFLSSISYEEAACMAENGAKILFPKTLWPAKRNGIAVYVKSSHEPNLDGTKIFKENNSDFRVVGLAVENNVLTVIGNKLINIEDEIKRFVSEFGAEQIEMNVHFLKYKFLNKSNLHLALYSLHSYLFSE
jgi:aspartate kinase